MARLLHCPQCRQEKVLREQPVSAGERVAALLMMSPFSCQHCSCRFMASRIGVALPERKVERRQHLRIPVRLYLSFSGGKVRGEGIVMDLSVGGCIIKSDTQVHVDDIFYLEITTDQDEPPLEVAAMVRSVSQRGIAFKFLRAAQENKRLLAFVQSRTLEHHERLAPKLRAAS
ncbi:MAG TPA: PilZ domain-containing protein [Nitrospira sp.]|nr:PilZ domain-containing protein [Nitrospira sp.]